MSLSRSSARSAAGALRKDLRTSAVGDVCWRDYQEPSVGYCNMALAAEGVLAGGPGLGTLADGLWLVS